MAWLAEHFRNKLYKVPTAVNVSDVGTKPLPKDSFIKHREFLGERPLEDVGTVRCACRCRSSMAYPDLQCASFATAGSNTCHLCTGVCFCPCNAGEHLREAGVSREELDLAGHKKKE